MVLTDESRGYIFFHILGEGQVPQRNGNGMSIRIGKGQLVVMVLYSQGLEQKTNTPLFYAYIENTLFQYLPDELEFVFQGFLFLFRFQFVQSFPDNRKGIFYRFPEFRPLISWDVTFQEIMFFRGRQGRSDISEFHGHDVFR